MRKIIALSIFSVASYQTAHATSNCLNQFYDHAPAVLQKDTLKKNTFPLCFNGFAVTYSGVSKTPLWSAEHLTPQRLSQKIKREDNFHEETQIPIQYRSTLKDYRASGYDRGHMSPNADMPDSASQNDSFSLANMVPQAPKNNQEVWRKLEEATRAMVTKKNQDVYVVTGPIYSGSKVGTVGNGVLIPTAVYKAVYYPKTGVIGAYLAPNDNSLKVQTVSVCAVEQLAGINLFPTLDDNKKRKVYDLPLSSTTIQKTQQISTDTQSKCAQPVSTADLQHTQQPFGTVEKQSNTGGWLQVVKNILANLLEFISKMLK